MAVPDPSRPGKHTLSVRNPTAKSAGRALTTSFGSICYGSLIIALIQLLRALVRNAADQAAQDGNMFAFFCIFCVDCLLSIIEAIAQYFNKVRTMILVFLFTILINYLTIVRLHASRHLRQGFLYCWKGIFI